MVQAWCNQVCASHRDVHGDRRKNLWVLESLLRSDMTLVV